jgi:DNA-binding GntR family transcriptional regulator
MSDLLITDNVPIRDLVLRKLRDAILSGKFQPGQRLLERELVERMGVSRTPIREALRKLEQEGLVTTIPYKGLVVAEFSEKSAHELYETRAALEGMAVALFTERADDVAIARLETHIENASKALTERASLQRVLAANNAFHDEIVSGCGNSLLQSMIANLRHRIVLLRAQSLSQPGRLPRAVRDHRAILRFIKRRNRDGARKLIERHAIHAWKAVHAQIVGGEPS